jgi:preprotein translocase subunit SecB
MSNPPLANIAAPDGQVFSIAQIFLQRAEFGYRRPPMSLPGDTQLAPQQLGVTLNLQHLSEGEASLVTCIVFTNPEDGDEKALYDFSVEMAAVVHQVNRDKFADKQLIEVVGAMLYPFIRELVANLTIRGRFGPVWLNPFNLRLAMQNAVREQTAAKEGEKESPTS